MELIIGGYYKKLLKKEVLEEDIWKTRKKIREKKIKIDS